ncbi:hypothetical protein M422DRAFT_271736 [Sphaerobolus stellatus SS14]|uniref:Uncharacterized protein n=1 Tax=Sphaerobolus stellatus (strain SS14) TaxID=990650 RepID=A0A0C9TZ59_SPHS4|nr:hypothetical protein M422DRAFT_271736 [Sphaerobolus stellatus SS14]
MLIYAPSPVVHLKVFCYAKGIVSPFTDKGEALLDVLLELGEGSVDELLLLGGDVAEVVDLGDTVVKDISINISINNRLRGLTPSSTALEKNSIPCAGHSGLLTKVGVTIPASPFKALNSKFVNFVATYAILNVADPRRPSPAQPRHLHTESYAQAPSTPRCPAPPPYQRKIEKARGRS